MKKTIKKFSAFTLAIMMFFGAIFSAFADNTILLNPPIFNDDPQLLQGRLQRTFEDYTFEDYNNDRPPRCLTTSMRICEELTENGHQDYNSRTVRFYSLPALFGDENRPSALISDFYSMMRAANLRIRALNISNGQSNDNRSDLETECRRFALNASGNITGPNDRLMVEENAYDVMGEFLRWLISNENNIPSWWDTHFNRDRTRRLIKENKTINNIWSVSLLLATAIKEKKWKYTDEKGRIQYNDFLVTATDETITRPNPSWLTKWIWSTIPNPKCAPASVKFVKSDQSLYTMDDNFKRQLPIKYGELDVEIWDFLGQFSRTAQRIAERKRRDLESKKIDMLKQEINNLKTRFEGTLGSMIATLAGLNPEERANFMAGWEALLRQFNANFVISQDAFNTLRNLNDRIASINRTLNNTNQHIDDLERGVNLQDEIIDALNNDLDTLHERLDTLTERFHWDLDEFSTYINNVYRNHPSKIFKFVLKHLFPDQIIE